MLTAIMAMFEMATSFVGASVSMDLSRDELLYFRDGQAREIDRAMMCLELGSSGCDSLKSDGLYRWDNSPKGVACAAQAAQKKTPDEINNEFNKCRCQSFTAMLDTLVPGAGYAFTPGGEGVVCQASSSYEAPDLAARLSHRLQVVRRDADTYSFYSCVRLTSSEGFCWHET